MSMVDGAVDGQPSVSTVVCRSVIPSDNSDSIYSFSVENASQSSLNSVATLATPMTSQSQVNLSDYGHVNLSTRRLPPGRHRSRPLSTVHLPTDQSSLHVYSCSNASWSSQNVCHSMPNLGTYEHVNPSSREVPRVRPASMIASPTSSCPNFSSGSLTIIAEPFRPVVPHNSPDIAVPGEVVTLMIAYPLFWPIAPKQVQRYERELVERKETDFWIDPLTTSFQSDTVPDEWVAHIHPEGARYFVHETKVSQCTDNYHDATISSGCLLPRIFTDINLYDPDKLELITKFMVDMEDYIRAKPIDIYPNVDLVLDLRRNPEDGLICCAYYFASHDDRSIFWLDDFNATYFDRWDDIKGVTAASQVGYEIESQYWYHCQQFPECREMDMNTINEVRDILIHCIGDLMTSDTANCPYGIPDLQQMLALTDSIKETVLSEHSHSLTSVSIISRFMFIFVQQRFYNFHGLPAARLECDKSVYGTAVKRTPLIILLSPLLFFAPDLYLDSLNKIWSDGLISKKSWVAFIQKIKAEWLGLIFTSTILLNINIAFLAIQSVDDTSAKEGRSPAQISSYVSIIASIGSIILGLFLLRQNRWTAEDSITEAWRFLRSQKRAYTGLETLAIMYSLPYALLVWAIMTFLSAFILMCFTTSDVDVRVFVGTACLVIAVFVFSCITALWKCKQSDPWYTSFSQFGTKVWHRLPRAPSVHVVEKVSRRSWTKTRHSVDSDTTAIGV
ncbi:hypothetical protein IW261DRAFT_1563230 [Armillaria novae-zelandiae]|uniref:WW domain-containing protein n=1 Tax=Armillaria novae-zelandiae TaxID=153914 RepID=A0AA39PAC2_9AGAR|nr:hypothetical protein IW261DRAFT_1563230 [Armillaria novae-zelandiae]